MKYIYCILFLIIQVIFLLLFPSTLIAGPNSSIPLVENAFFTTSSIQNFGAAPSVLSKGNWYRFAVLKRGVYKITSTELKAAGIDIASIDPKMIRIHGYGNGMLPQPNATNRPLDLPQVSILVSGELDGKFDTGDYILFYAEGPDQIEFDEIDERFHFQKNIYTDSAYYFLSVNESSGIRIQEKASNGINHPKVKSYTDFIYHENDVHNILSSGREWFGEQFTSGSSEEFTFEIFDYLPESPARFHFKMMSSNASPSIFSIEANSKILGEVPLEAIPRVNTVTGLNTYAVKGKENEKEFVENFNSFPQNLLTLSIAFKGTAGDGFAYLNNFLVNFSRSLTYRREALYFNNATALFQPNITFEIENKSSESLTIWNISDPLTPFLQTTSKNGSNLHFGAESISFQEYVAFDYNNLPSPVFINKVENQNIKAAIGTELLIISFPEFLSEAKRLASFRESHDNLKVTVVTPSQIYNEFSSGRQDVTAIRDYVKYLYDNGNIKYLLLFGKCSYAYKDNVIQNTNFVPTYQSYNSLHPVESYSSDDYFGFMEEEEGAWPENVNPGDHDLEIGIGRLPVKTNDEAKIVVNKIIHYNSNPDAFGSWRNEIIFVADDEDGNTHQKDADKLASMIDTANVEYHVNKIYLGSFLQDGNSSVSTRNALNDAIKKGALIVNYSGHGNESVWAEEKILNTVMINEWENYDRLSLFVTATCEFGKYDNPLQISGGEALLLSSKGGAIGLVTTSRPVYSNTNFLLNSALYNVIFTKDEAGNLRLGDIIKSTKNNSLSGYRNRNFSLLGDPSLTLSIPKKDIVITDIFAEDGTIEFDTLKASSKININGFVSSGNDSKDLNFSGVANVTIYDKPSPATTLPENGTTMTYEEQTKVLFRGKVSIEAGEFAITFIVPKNIDYTYGEGKLSIYGYDEFNKEDAHSGFTDLVIGGSVAPISDEEPPVITLYLNDESFQSGDLTGSNALLLARLEDESGINISSNGLDQNLSASINQNKNFVLNNFFENDLDDYKKGWISYPLNGLEDGSYILNLKAWDINSNFSEKSLNFIVSSDAKIALNSVLNYPNPFNLATTFSINHNRAGDNLEIALIIYSMKGDIVHESKGIYNNSLARIEELVWDGTNSHGLKLSQGIYTYKVILRSLTDQSRTQAYQRLVIIN